MNSERYSPGEAVKVSVAHHFKGHKLGFTTGYCKDGFPHVYLLDEQITTRDVCVNIERGDTIVRVTKKFVPLGEN